MFPTDLLFPKRCVGCRKFGVYFCGECIANIKQGELVCPICEKGAVGGQTHPFCRHRNSLDGLWSLGVYGGALRSAITQLKYKWVRVLAEELIDLVVQYWAFYQPFILDKIKRSQGKGWVVVPVPLHALRQRWRGFNQSALIGQSLSKRLGLDYSDVLKRTRFTKPQVGLKGKLRQENIKGAFAITSDFKPQTMNYVLLIDDVWTTGSTLRECAKVLKKAGAKQVWALTLAR